MQYWIKGETCYKIKKAPWDTKSWEGKIKLKIEILNEELVGKFFGTIYTY